MRTRQVGSAAWRNLRPLRVATGAAMAAIDRRAQSEWALAGSVLMENAGANAYAAVRADLWAGCAAPGPLVFVAGRGNNGGDALVMARHASNGGADDVVVVLAAGEPRPGGAPAANLAACRALGIPVAAGPDADAAIAAAAWIFDGITGTGLRAELAAPAAAVVERINAAPGKVIAIDVPSGLRDGYRSGPLVRANATVTIGLPKRCLYLPVTRTAAGEILVVAAGFPRPLLTDPAAGCDLLATDLLSDLLPAAAIDAHKGTRGHVAAELAARHPHAVARLILSELVDWRAHAEHRGSHARQFPAPPPARDGSHLLALWNQYASMLDEEPGEVRIEDVQRRFLALWLATYQGPRSATAARTPVPAPSTARWDGPRPPRTRSRARRCASGSPRSRRRRSCSARARGCSGPAPTRGPTATASSRCCPEASR